MRKSMQGVCIIAMLLFAIPACVSASEYQSTRAYAMGGAYTALASDLSALQINPAGLGQSDFEVTLGGSVNDLEFISVTDTDDFWQIALEKDLKVQGQAGFRVGGLGLGLFGNGSASKQIDADSGQDVILENINGRLSFGYGTKLIKLCNLRIGGSVDKIQGKQETYYFDTGTSTIQHRLDKEWEGYALNVGLLANVGPLRAGVAVRDIYGNINIDNNIATITQQLDPVYRAGAALQLPFGITLAADYELPPGDPFKKDEQSEPVKGTLHMGAETRLFFNALSIRAGQVVRPDQTTLTTAGLGFNIGPLHADFAVGSENQFKTNEFTQAKAQFTVLF